MVRKNMQGCDIDEAHRLYDRKQDGILWIESWNDTDIVIRSENGDTTRLYNARLNDRFVPIRISGMVE